MESDAPYFPGGCLPTASDYQHASTPPPPPHHYDGAVGGAPADGSAASRGGSLPGVASASGASAQAAHALLGLANKPGPGTRLAELLGDSSASPSLSHKAAAGGSLSSGMSLRRLPEATVERARIVDPLQVYDNINLGRRIDPMWPDESWRSRGGRNFWKDWLPEAGMEGPVVHRWTPCHREPLRRSHVDKTIVLLRIGERYVPIVESATAAAVPDRAEREANSEPPPDCGGSSEAGDPPAEQESAM